MTTTREKAKLALAEDIIKTEERFKSIVEVIKDNYKDINQKTDKLMVNINDFEKFEISNRVNIKNKIEYLERLTKDFPDQLDLNEKLLEGIVTKIRSHDNKKQISSTSSNIQNRRIYNQELRNHMARIKKIYPEKICFIKGEELILNGKTFFFSEEKGKLIRRSKSAKAIKEQDEKSE